MQELVAKNPSLADNETVQSILNADTTEDKRTVVSQ